MRERRRREETKIKTARVMLFLSFNFLPIFFLFPLRCWHFAFICRFCFSPQHFFDFHLKFMGKNGSLYAFNASCYTHTHTHNSLSFRMDFERITMTPKYYSIAGVECHGYIILIIIFYLIPRSDTVILGALT